MRPNPNTDPHQQATQHDLTLHPQDISEISTATLSLRVSTLHPLTCLPSQN